MAGDGAGRAGGLGSAEDEAAAVELSEVSLVRWGRRVGEAATAPGEGPGVFVALHGPLGAGKTALVRAACRGAGVEGAVRSPTFTLHNHHRPPGRRPVHHVDLYRLEGPGDLDDLGWEELLTSRGAVFVEWAERAGARLPADRWEIRLSMTDDPGLRRVAARALGGALPLPEPPRVGAPGGEGGGGRPPRGDGPC